MCCIALYHCWHWRCVFVRGAAMRWTATNDDDNHLKIIIKLQTIRAIWNAIPKSDMHFHTNWETVDCGIQRLPRVQRAIRLLMLSVPPFTSLSLLVISYLNELVSAIIRTNCVCWGDSMLTRLRQWRDHSEITMHAFINEIQVKNPWPFDLANLQRECR